jgi:quercetin dioxygenase-like cupin family protein
MYKDPVTTDGDKYKVLTENERVRVLEYRDMPGAKTSRHYHPDFVLYALGPFKRQLTLGNGKTVIRESKAGDVLWSQAQDHIGENIGTSETHVIIVELKENAPSNHD